MPNHSFNVFFIEVHCHQRQSVYLSDLQVDPQHLAHNLSGKYKGEVEE